jgi:hypothetical protein
MCLILDGAYVSLDLRDVFILSKNVETDVSKHVLQCLKLGVGISDSHFETLLTIEFSHLVKACSHSGDSMVQQIFDHSKM